MSDDVTGTRETIYNRPALVTDVYGDTAYVRWQDTGTLSFVPLTHLEA